MRISLHRRPGFLAPLCVWLLSVGLASSALAEETADPVLVEGDRIPGEDPGAPTRPVSRVELEERPEVSSSVAEPLQSVPGVNLRRFGTPGQPIFVGLRGSSADQVVFRLGAIPLTPPGGGHVDLAPIPPAAFSHATVLRGAAGASHGAGALGGAIVLHPLSGDPRADAELAGGAFGTGITHLRAVGPALGGELAGAISGLWTEGDFDYQRDLTPTWDGDDRVTETRENNRARRLGGLLAGGWRVGGGRLELTALGHLGERGDPGVLGQPTPSALAGDHRGLMGLEYTGDPVGTHGLVAHALAYGGQDGYLYDPGPEATLVQGAPSRGRRLTGGVGLSGEGAFGPVVLSLGLDGAASQLSVTGAEASRGRLAVTSAATLYTLDEALTVHGAFRLEAYTGEQLAALPSLGVEVRLTDALALFAGGGRGLRMPTLYERYADTALVLANPDLRPEVAWSGETGLRLTHRRGTVTLGAFTSRYDDLITWELYPPFRVRPYNVRSAAVHGVELEGHVALDAHWALSGAWASSLSRNLRPDANELGEALPYRPPHQGRLEVLTRWARAEGSLSIYGQSAVTRNRAGTKTLPARLRVDAAGQVHLLGGLSLGLTLTNLLNDRRAEDLFGYPLPGFGWMVSLRWSTATAGGASS